MSPAAPLVEREVVLAQLQAHLRQAQQGIRQVVLLAGEPGIGKTAVVEAFLAQVEPQSPLGLAQGQCVESYGSSEPYRPVLEALGQLCRSPEGARCVPLLRQHAPTWLVQLPWLLTTADRVQLQTELQGATRERMLREGAEFVEALTAETPLVLVLEDLHWSDGATLDLFAALARRRTPARLLLVGTYRLGEALAQEHPLRTVVQDQQRQGYSTTLALAALSPAAVAAYLAARCPGHAFPATLAAWVHARTEGNPLFVVTLVQALMAQGTLAWRDGRWTMLSALAPVDIPETLRQFIEHQCTRVAPETQQVLAVASVAGVVFTTARVAAGLAASIEEIEAQCAALARWQLVREVGLETWPDTTVTTRYAFTHALVQQVAYERLGRGQRVQWHRRLGEALETAYGPRAADLAAELAVHFERGHDVRRAVHYLQQAAANAAQRYAHREVIDLLSRAMELLPQLPEGPARTQPELAIQLALGGTWMAVKSFTAPEAGRAYARARVLCQQVEDMDQRFPAVFGVWFFLLVDGALQTAQELADQLFLLARQCQDTARLLVARWAQTTTSWHRGAFPQALTHAQRGVRLYALEQHRALALYYIFDPGVACRSTGATVLWLLGAPDQALAWVREACSLAQELAYPLSLEFALITAALVHQVRREPRATSEQAAAFIALCTTYGPAQYAPMGRLWQAWVLAMQGSCQEALVQMRQSMAALRASRAAVAWEPYLLTLLAEVAAQAGQYEEGLCLLAEAQTVLETVGEHWWTAEVHRLHGELLRQQASAAAAQAEACFHQALTVARRQHAKSLELRAAMSLVRLWQQQDKGQEAYALLAPVYGCFTEGFDTADLQEAQGLLAALREGRSTAHAAVACALPLPPEPYHRQPGSL